MPMSPRPARALALAVLLALPLAATAGTTEVEPRTEVLTAGFLRYHPDIKHRLDGVQAMERGDPAAALDAFRKAARWADKSSQAMVAEMLWKGQGTAVDRAGAYAWMDLAAERGYRPFATLRERYWAQLDAAERERALAVGQSVYADFGDAVAKPRLERELKRGSRQVTGSRVGSVGALRIMIPGPGGSWMTVDGETYYARHYWQPKAYFEWQDQIWRDPPTGTVEVGELQDAAAATPPAGD